MESMWLEHCVDADVRDYPALALHAVRVDNGVPVASVWEFRRFLSAWRDNDPNGTWYPEGVSETPHSETGSGDTLIYWDLERDYPDVWSAVDTDAEGNALYALAGWDWIK